MKNKLHFTFSLFFLFSGLNVLAQQATEVKEISESIIGEKRGATYQVGIYMADEKEILKQYKSTLKKNGGEIKVKGGILYASSLIMPLINADTIGLVAKAKEVENNLHYLHTIFETKKGEVISSEDVSGHTAIKAFLYDFANDLSLKSAEDFYNKRNKELESLNRKLKTEIRNKENAEKNIVKYKKKLVKSEFLIEELKAEKEIDKDVLAKKENAQKDVVSYNKKIRNLEYDIVESDKNQKKLKKQIEKAKEVVKEAKKAVNVFN